MQDRPSRKTLRFAGYDYRAPCTVHVVVCTQNRQALFGNVTQDGMMKNRAGELAEASLGELTSFEAGIEIDTWIVMPDHVHAIVVLGTNPDIDTSESVGDVVRRFKLRTVKAWPGGIRRGWWEPYESHLWQRSYYDALIHDDRQLDLARGYILDNPRQWWEHRADSLPPMM